MSTLAKDLKVADASRLASNLRLTAVRVSGIKAQTVGLDLAGTSDWGWKLLPINLLWAISDGQLRIVVPVTLHILRTTTEPPEVAAEIGVLLRLDYEVVDVDREDSGIASFVGISGCMHAWPYLRSEIQQLSTKLELPPLLLPPVVSGNVAQIVGTVTRTPMPKARVAPKPKKKTARLGRTKRRSS